MSMSITKKRFQTMGAIVTAALGAGSASALPTPTLELPKQAVIAISDITLCASIYTIWFDRRVTTEEMQDMLLDFGLLSVTGGILIYAGVKTAEGLLAEAMNIFGPIGWSVSAVITGSVTITVGVAFWLLCEKQPVPLAARTA